MDKTKLNMEIINPESKMKQTILNEITKAIRQINYGEIVITIHNSKIVQIEKKEKKRFNDQNGRR